MNDASAIAREMNAAKLGGVRFEATTKKIGHGEKYGGETIPMVRIVVTDKDQVRSSEIGARLLRAIYSRHPKQFRWQAGVGIEELSGSRALRNAVENGGIDAVIASWRADAEQFVKRAEPYRLYERVRR
jgi:uncharacterized protein YbbC (DUF1343 family)